MVAQNDSINCPSCGKVGKPVETKTVKSLLVLTLRKIDPEHPYFFCPSKTCPVVYYNPLGEVFKTQEVKLPVFQKEPENPNVPVCYCFGHTVNEIREKAKVDKGKEILLDITQGVKLKQCACEIRNPQGSCCLGNVNEIIKRVAELHSSNPGEKIDKRKDKKWEKLPLIGSIFTAIVASLCCIGPVILTLLGGGSVVLFSKFINLRPYFIGITIILLGLAFYLTYKQREIICEDGNCKIKDRGKWNKMGLWGTTILIAFFLAFPYLRFANRTLVNGSIAEETSEIIIPVEGMTCPGCEVSVERAIRGLDGIREIKADYQKGKVYVKFEKEKVTLNKVIETINQSGYNATEVETLQED